MDALASYRVVWGRACHRAVIIVTILFPISSAGADPFRASAAGTTAVLLTWTAPGDDGTAGAASRYDIRFDTSPVMESSWDRATPVNQVPAPRPSGVAETLLVAGLNPGTVYYFTLRSADEVPNWSSLSNLAVISTCAETVPPSCINDLAIDSVSSNAVVLRWAAPGDDGDSGKAAAYDLRYAADSLTLALWNGALPAAGEPTPAAAGTPQTCKLEGLTPGAVYFFALKAVDDAANWSPLSNVVSARCVDASMLPVADFTGSPTIGSAPLTVNFTDRSLRAVSWVWEFGDGASSTAQFPQHVFAAAGTYTITLTAQNGYGASQKVKSGYIVVSPPPRNVLHVGALRFTKESWFTVWRAAAKVQILDELGRPVAGAVVTGKWSGGVTGSAQATTGSDGWCTVRGKWRPGTAKVVLCVTQVAKAGWTYNAQANTASCVESGTVASGNLVASDTTETELPGTVLDTLLAVNYPNPFNARTVITFSVPDDAPVTIAVYNLLGQHVRLLAERFFDAGVHRVTWDGTDDHGRQVASGVYLYRITYRQRASVVKKMVLVR